MISNELILAGRLQLKNQRVERASSEAAREVFGNNYQSVLEQVHVDDDALVEGKQTVAPSTVYCKVKKEVTFQK